MNNEIQIDPAEALRRIITNLAARYRSETWPLYSGPAFWSRIMQVSGYSSAYSSHLATMHGFNADTGESL